MPKRDYRMPTRRERELFKQARELQARIDALEKDPSAKLEISRLEDIVAERDAVQNPKMGTCRLNNKTLPSQITTEKGSPFRRYPKNAKPPK